MATNKAEHDIITDINSAAGQAFITQLHALMVELAQQIVRDGEGASKFITVRVTTAANEADARKIAFSIANSPSGENCYRWR